MTRSEMNITESLTIPLTIITFCSEWKKFGENIVKNFLCDETTWTLGLEYSVQALHLGLVEPNKN